MTRLAIALLFGACVSAEKTCASASGLSGNCDADDGDDFSVLQTKLKRENTHSRSMGQPEGESNTNEEGTAGEITNAGEVPPGSLLEARAHSQASMGQPEGGGSNNEEGTAGEVSEGEVPPGSLLETAQASNDCSSGGFLNTLSNHGWTFSTVYHSSKLTDSAANELLGYFQKALCWKSQWGDYKSYLSSKAISYRNPSTLPWWVSFQWTRNAPRISATYYSTNGNPTFSMGVGPNNLFVLVDVTWQKDSSTTYNDVLLVWKSDTTMSSPGGPGLLEGGEHNHAVGAGDMNQYKAPPPSLLETAQASNDCSSGGFLNTLSNHGWTFSTVYHSSKLTDSAGNDLLGHFQKALCWKSQWGDYKEYLSSKVISSSNPSTLPWWVSFVWTRNAPRVSSSYKSTNGNPTFSMGVGPNNLWVLADVTWQKDSTNTWQDVLLVWKTDESRLPN